MNRPASLPPVASFRLRGDSYLRMARALAIPGKVGRPRKGTVRFARPNDAERTRRSALVSARYWYSTAARYVRTRALVHGGVS